MIYKLSFTAAAMALALSACTSNEDKSIDRGVNTHALSDMRGGIWVDPNGCDHWIIDDGLEGYMSPRLDKSGNPVCSGIVEPTYVTDGLHDHVMGDPI